MKSRRHYTRLPGDNTELEAVDVALVMESTYPYLKGGVSAVIHDLITHQPDITFGIIHTTWDSQSPLKELYEVPANVAWVDVIFLSLEEHHEEFTRVVDSKAPRGAVEQFQEAVKGLERSEVSGFWQLYDEAINPLSRTWRLWSVLSQDSFMRWCVKLLPDMHLSSLYWTVRDFFSLAYAVSDRVFPRAKVYHAHTTGYANLIAACAARQHHGACMLTEHNLYVRDAVNTLLGRPLNQKVTRVTYKEVTEPVKRMWTVWWTAMGTLFYPSNVRITYLYNKAIAEAGQMGSLPEKSVVVPNGMEWDKFAHAREVRRQRVPQILRNPHHHWRLACIARVVPIKGILELIDAVAILQQGGWKRLSVDILGPTEHHPEYYQRCLERREHRKVGDGVNFLGTVNLQDHLHNYDALVLSSFNEGQPIVALEGMSAGLPVIATDVGGLTHLVTDPLGEHGTIGPCGTLVRPGDPHALAIAIERMITNPQQYLEWHYNAQDRVQHEFLMESVMERYTKLYRDIGL